VIVAKIRIFKGVWLGMRDQAGRPPPLPKNIYLAKIELLDVLGGSAKSGDQLDVFIATTATVRRYMTPSTPAMKARDYFVATFADSENQRRLLGLPGSQVEFERWQAELSKDSSSTMEHQK